MSITKATGLVIAAFAWTLWLSGTTSAQTPPAVSAIVDGRLAIGDAQMPVFVSADWSRPLPAVRRAVVVIHGYGRNAADYARNMVALAPVADTLVVAPQFLAPEDIAAHQLPAAILRWDHTAWSSGYPALGPTALSSFSALDAILQQLANRQILPNITEVVIAGFSAGGQILQRYAIVGGAERVFAGTPVHLRYVIGSPSSYAYFSDERPLPDGTFAVFTGAATCPDFNRWKYGFAGDLPAYVAIAMSPGIKVLEQHYAARDVVYLVGSNDTDPNHRYLDKSCAGEAQGPTRLARTQFFFAEMQRRAGNALKRRLWVIDGPAHNEARVLGSACGRAALFSDTECAATEGSK